MDTILKSRYIQLLAEPVITPDELDSSFESFIKAIIQYCQGQSPISELYFCLNYIKVLLIRGECRHENCKAVIHVAVLYMESVIAWVFHTLFLTSFDRTDTQSISKSTTILKWTDEIINLVEIIYACHTVEPFNKGKVTLKCLSDYICAVFGVNIENISNYYAKIRQRKADDRAYFINRLHDALLKRMDEDDEKWRIRNR